MIHGSHTTFAASLVGLLLVVSAPGWSLPTHAVDDLAAPDATVALQADESHPLWAALAATGLDRARWATLLTTDADGNRRTDFLDLVVSVASATGHMRTPVELLAYADAPTRADLVARPSGAVDIQGIDGVFLTLPLDQLGKLDRPGVSLVVFEPRMKAAATDPAGGDPASLPQVAISQGGDAWALGYNGTGVKIAILDSGVDGAHDAFADPGKITDFLDCVGTGASTYDDHGHGTRVASIAAGNDGGDFSGIAPGATVVPVKVLDAAGSGTLAQFQCGVDHVRDLKLAGGTIVASASLGLGVLGLTTLNGGPFDVFGFDRVAERLPQAGVPFTIAAGNWVGTLIEILDADESPQAGVNGVNQVSSPGFANLVITVGSATDFEAHATHSALGPGKANSPLPEADRIVKPDVVAHGFDTWGAVFGGAGDDYTEALGTSYATPIAAGTVAILMQKNAALTPAEYKHALHAGAEPAWFITNFMDHPLHPNFASGYGVVKAANSLALV